MAAKWQRAKIRVPEYLKPNDRKALGLQILNFIRKRTKNRNVDRRNRPFAKYSKSYVNSLDFKNAGKSKNIVNLTLSGDMLAAMKLISHKRGELLIGFENGTEENARADGNIRGTYGAQTKIAAKRDFLGITKKDLNGLLESYPEKKEDKKKFLTLERLNLLEVARLAGLERARQGREGN